MATRYARGVGRAARLRNESARARWGRRCRIGALVATGVNGATPATTAWRWRGAIRLLMPRDA